MTLPEGLTINPDAADGQIACTDAEANFNSDEAAHCPDNSKIGTFELHTPSLPDAADRRPSTSASLSPATSTGS